MKPLLLILFCSLLNLGFSQSAIKSKNLKIRYTLPPGWNVSEFGTKNWEEPGNETCKCGGAYFFKTHAKGKMNVVIYPSSRAGIDSVKRNYVGSLAFQDVEKFDKIKTKYFSFEKRRSNFKDMGKNAKSFEVIRYKAKVEDYFYIIYAWQENMGPISPDTEREIFEMVNAIEPL